MKLLMTGSTGLLGSYTIAELDAADVECQIIPTDVCNRYDRPIAWQPLDLLDEAAVREAMAGVDAVVHLGNYTGAPRGRYRTHAKTFNENVAMNYNVFSAATDAGAKKIIFASSIQVIASAFNWPADPPHADRIAYLPLDHDSPPNPTNSYALSKRFSEELLDQFFSRFDVQCVSLRLPWLRTDEQLAEMTVPAAVVSDERASRIAQGFAFLSYRDAARAIVACLTTDLPGHRIYFPAVSKIVGDAVRPTLDKLYADVPLKRPVDRIDQLCDYTKLTEDTGWEPRHSMSIIA